LEASAVPDWLRDELNNSEEGWIEFNQKSPTKSVASLSPKKISSADHRKKVEKDYNEKTKELFLEAQSIVRQKEYNQVIYIGKLKLSTEIAGFCSRRCKIFQLRRPYLN